MRQVKPVKKIDEPTPDGGLAIILAYLEVSESRFSLKCGSRGRATVRPPECAIWLISLHVLF
jgi:hypothetical protein